MRNLTLTDLIAEERLFGAQVSAGWTAWDGRPGFANVSGGGQTEGSVDVLPGRIRSVNVGQTYLPRPEDAVAGDTNFTTYQTAVAGNPAHVSLYKIGAQNSELQLTYTSFARWQTSEPAVIADGTTGRHFETRYLVFGVQTPEQLLAARTGQASYRGVVYGTGASPTGQLYDVGGTSRFVVDFTAGSYGGVLNLTGRAPDGAVRQFGEWTFASFLRNGFLGQATLNGPTGREFGSFINPRFYGPTGEEIGATFNVRTASNDGFDAVHISGVTVAKQD